MANAYLTYAITEIFCCIFALILLFHLDASLGSEHEVRQLKNLIYCYLIFVVTDIFWALTEGQIIEPPHYLNAAVNAVSVASVVMGCLQWFWFVTERLNPGREYADYIHVLSAIPAIAVILMDVISIFTGWMFFIDRNNHYVTTDLFAVQAMGTYLYLMAAAVLSFIHLFRPHSVQQKSEFLMYSALMIPVMAAGFFEDLIPSVPILAMCIFLMLYLLFLMIQNMQIFNDALTGLNNRRCLMQYLDEKMKDASEENPVTVFMLDINDFKSINDRFGHVEGDMALRKFAGIMKGAADRYGIFAARYGGDEFCFVENGSSFIPDELVRSFQEFLRERQENEVSPYRLTASIGYAVCRYPESKTDVIVNAADRMLYMNKREWHRRNH